MRHTTTTIEPLEPRWLLAVAFSAADLAGTFALFGEGVSGRGSVSFDASGNLTGGSYAYRSSKAGLNAVVKSLAIDLAPREILVLALHPGWAKTEPGAAVDVDRSVAGMRAIIERCSRHETGSFLAYNDMPLPW